MKRKGTFITSLDDLLTVIRADISLSTSSRITKRYLGVAIILFNSTTKAQFVEMVEDHIKSTEGKTPTAAPIILIPKVNEKE